MTISQNINIDEFSESLNDKMDRDGNNASDAFINEVVERVRSLSPSPDWSRRVIQAVDTNYTALEDGFIYGHFGYGDDWTYTIIINGTTVYSRGTPTYADVNCFYSLPIAKGDTYRLTGGDTINFVPYK